MVDSMNLKVLTALATIQGRAIYIRYVWHNVTPTSTHFEQAFSSDGGKTWEVNWIYEGGRLPAQ
jgi:hypothetical protein